MLIAASTIKDSVSHVRRFVAGNLAGGLDHLVVFLDQPGADEQDDVAAFLDEHAHVTCVRAGPGWWGRHRPAGLNERQCVNATAVAHLVAGGLAGGAVVDWVFHIDGDEVVRLDREALADVPPEYAAVRLAPREAVSRLIWDGEPTLFKRLLGEPDLRLLHALGVLDEPTNRAYFHGHLQGKSGVRPARDVFLGLHKAIASDASHAATHAATHADERLELFHYESYSGEEFVRKWSALATSGPRPSFRPGRAALADAVRTLLDKDLDADVRRTCLLALYRRTTEDDATTLHDLGLLLETDPLTPGRAPTALPGEAATGLRAALDELRGEDKRGFFRGSSPAGAEAAPARRDKSGRRHLLRRST